MLFHDGVDSQGRPVIVVNTDAVGTTRKARGQALQYMLHRLEPIVVQVSVVHAFLCLCLFEISFCLEGSNKAETWTISTHGHKHWLRSAWWSGGCCSFLAVLMPVCETLLFGRKHQS